MDWLMFAHIVTYHVSVLKPLLDTTRDPGLCIWKACVKAAARLSTLV